MTLKPILSLINSAFFEQFGRYLSDVETAILLGSLQKQTYDQIAQESGYSESYVRRDVGPKLWKMLSEALKEQVSKTNFQAALERRVQWQQSNEEIPNLEPLVPNRIDWGEAVDVSLFYGRESELNTLSKWIVQDKCRLIAVLGMGGIGKTVCSVKLAQLMSPKFELIIWRSLRNAPPLESLLSDLLLFLSNQQETKADIGRLIHYLRCSRCLLILDNMETILDAEQVGQYRTGYEKYGELLTVVGETKHQSCLLLTSREKPAEITTFAGVDLAVREMRLDGSPEAAIGLLQTKGVVGSLSQKQALGDRYGNNPLALKIVTSTTRQK